LNPLAPLPLGCSGNPGVNGESYRSGHDIYHGNPFKLSVYPWIAVAIQG
jgi:hypothetical protein